MCYGGCTCQRCMGEPDETVVHKKKPKAAVTINELPDFSMYGKEDFSLYETAVYYILERKKP